MNDDVLTTTFFYVGVFIFGSGVILTSVCYADCYAPTSCGFTVCVNYFLAAAFKTYSRMKPLCISLLVFFAHQVMDAQVTYAKLALQYGAYQVGFRHYTKVDNTRTYEKMYEWNNEVVGRPIPISLWFPSNRPTKKSRLIIQNYMTVLKEEEEWEQLPDERILDWFYYSNSAQNKIHLKEGVKAFGNTTPIPRKFPVVIYAPSYQASSVENFALCELLASHGYVVIASP